MNRSLTALFAAFEAVLVVAIGVGISLAPLTILWAAQYGFAPDWWDFWRASVDIWLVGHGVDLSITLNGALATSTGLQGAATPFAVTMAALGFSLLTILLGMRAGRRIAQTDHRLLGEAVAIGLFAALSLGLSLSASFPAAQPNLVQGTLLPTMVFAIGVVLGTLRASRPGVDAASRLIRTWVNSWGPQTRATVAASLRGGASAAAAIVAIASVVVAVLIVTSYAQIIELYEGLQAGALGGLALTIAQLAILPNLVLWGVSWLVGPGFAIGTGSAVSPIATTLGPIPAVPVLGALPTFDSPFAFVGILIPVLAGFLAGALLGSKGVRGNASGSGSGPGGGFGGGSGAGGGGGGFGRRGFASRARQSLSIGIPQTVITGLGMGLVGGALLGLLAWASGGAAGPGRLATVGPDPWQVGLWAALEIGIAATLGLLAATRLPSGTHPDDTSTPPLGFDSSHVRDALDRDRGEGPDSNPLGSFRAPPRP
ncbi:hypothetical protein B0I08_106236 [Glaciihabitans tibetensis]|uniref:Uncharacterized protein n=1 Tax=Glaciihabitans tibetensis TaxID=1266600 RepID=A0A2T0VBQ9_9MICO|nr:DUF6350 family protein [Glaciihabitans tibetensis]PRY67629.1 hypothetical protein B0I08_106236 [Glaciihabitans tibetensis]